MDDIELVKKSFQLTHLIFGGQCNEDGSWQALAGMLLMYPSLDSLVNLLESFHVLVQTVYFLRNAFPI